MPSRSQRPPRTRRSTLRRIFAALLVVVLCTLAVAGGIAGGRALADREPELTTVQVTSGGTTQSVSLQGPQTVASVLIMAGVVPRDGRLFSRGTRSVIDPQLNPASITVDGAEAEEQTPVLTGQTIEVSKGADAVEGTTTELVPIPAEPLPDVLRHVHRRGREGVARVERGVVSGEVITRTVVREPVAPTRVTDRVVALTFDDGPTEAWTPIVLRILAEKGVKATFCTVGTNVNKSPELVRQVVAAGHQTCDGTLGHVLDLGGADAGQIDEQLDGGLNALTDAGVPPPPYYRPPGGSLSDEVIGAAHERDEEVLYWKVDTEDWRTTATPESILANVQAQTDNGAIILLHDGGGRDRIASVLTLSLVIDWLRSQGYSFVFPVLG